MVDAGMVMVVKGSPCEGWARSRLRSGVVILEVSRNPASLMHALARNAELQLVQHALQQASLDHCGPYGAMMLVYPHQYHAVEMMVKNWDLQRRHIITSLDLEAIVKQVVESLPKKDRVRIKSSRHVPGSELHAREQRIVIRDRNTFLDVEDLDTERSGPGSAGTKSTTDACRRKGRNPRSS